MKKIFLIKILNNFMHNYKTYVILRYQYKRVIIIGVYYGSYKMNEIKK